jgi:hypothetical protein
MTALIVGWDSYINKLSWRVSIAKSNNWNVDIGSFLDSLGIGTWVGNNDEAGFLERSGNVIGKVTWGETTSNGDGTGVGGELENGTLTIWTGRNDTDIGWVVYSCDNSGSENNLFPRRIFELGLYPLVNCAFGRPNASSLTRSFQC